MYKIYKITNLINGKIYVGQTKNSLEKRFKQHCILNSKMIISQSINKYGKDNFKIELLETCETLEEINQAEIKWIKNLNSLMPNGYNVLEGGNNKTMPEYIRKKAAIKNSGINNHMFGKKHTEESRNKMTDTRTGMKLSESHKKNISKANLHKPPSNGKLYKGITYSTKRKKWIAQIKVNKICIRLGAFILPEDAAKAYDKALMIYYGEGYLNFKEEYASNTSK